MNQEQKNLDNINIITTPNTSRSAHPRKSRTTRTKHKVDQTTGCRDTAILDYVQPDCYVAPFDLPRP